jgi:hypothetical protein
VYLRVVDKQGSSRSPKQDLLMAVFVDEVTRPAAGHTDWEWGSMEHGAGVSTRQVSHGFMVKSVGFRVAFDVAMSCLAQGVVTGGGDRDATHRFVDEVCKDLVGRDRVGSKPRRGNRDVEVNLDLVYSSGRSTDRCYISFGMTVSGSKVINSGAILLLG